MRYCQATHREIHSSGVGEVNMKCLRWNVIEVEGGDSGQEVETTEAGASSWQTRPFIKQAGEVDIPTRSDTPILRA